MAIVSVRGGQCRVGR